jgi:predicted acetylornithine/succinylornithine family transaminase
MNASEVIAGEAQFIVPTYVRPDLVFSHGQGAYLFDNEGRRYLDFTSGIAVTALGHSDQAWVEAVSKQARQLTHVSNLYHTAPQVEMARRLVENSFADRVFFCNSGSEANETALKFARKFARIHHASDGESDLPKVNIVAFSGSFHGRTMGSLAATYKSNYREPFEPLVPGVTFAAFNDLEAARAEINEATCAVIVEPIQGEGGVNLAEPDFLHGLRALCDEFGALLIFDEVQCGLGRTGSLWAHQAYGVTPDIMTLAKPLAGGLPIGAVLVSETVAQVFQVGDHGSTFAAGPLVCQAAKVVFDRVSQPEFLAAVAENGRYLTNLLQTLASDEELAKGRVIGVRGTGLLVGVEFTVPVAPLIAAARDRGLLVISAGENVLRLCPPLIVTQSQIVSAVEILGDSLGAWEIV